MRNLVTSAAFLGGLLVTTATLAQETQGQANVGMSLPGAAPAAARAGTSDHDQMVGRLAVGYFGVTQVGAGADDTAAYAVVGDAPVIGVRYWFTRLIGMDVGLGLGIIGGNYTDGAPEVEVDKPSFTGFNLHGGVPLALASSDHFTFEIIPEINIGIGNASVDPNGAAEGNISYSGFHFDLGARAGAEIHFGFIKLPQLALQGSVGLAFAVDNGSTTDSTPGAPLPDAEASSSQTSFSTTVQGEPWDIFTGNLAALYYF